MHTRAAARDGLVNGAHRMATNIKLHSPASIDAIREIVRQGCPDLEVGRLGPALVASRSAWVAAAISVQGKTISVMPMVRDAKMMLLMLLVLVSGVGLLLYAIMAIPKQQEVTKRVHALLSRELEAVR